MNLAKVENYAPERQNAIIMKHVFCIPFLVLQICLADRGRHLEL